MKQLLYLTLGLTMLTACSLDEDPQDQIPEEEVYATRQALYQNAVATLYNYIGGSKDGEGLQGTIRGVYDLQTFGSDEAMLPTRGIDWYDGGMWQAMYKHSWQPNHELLGNAWKYLYKVITLCNNSLERLDRHQDLAGAEGDHWKAEVKVLRAMYYWYLIDLFGDVPLITEVETSMADVRSTPRAMVFSFIFNELLHNLDLTLNVSSVNHGEAYGRITRPVALFLLAKLMLNASVYTLEEEPLYYKFCIDFCNEIEDLGYSLAENYSDNFIVDNENSPENIFVIPMDKGLYSNQQWNVLRSLHYRHAAALGIGGENGSCATLNTLRIFGYGTDEMDKRFDDNFYHGSVFDYDGKAVLDRQGNTFRYVPEAVELDLSNSPFIETAGARMRKYRLDPNSTNGGKLVDNDIVLFRFADVLLMRAEAKLRLGLDGHDDYDRVRRRSNMPTRPCTLQNLLDERLLELCWEGWRRQDLIRFKQYRSLYEGPGAVDESDGHTAVFPIPANVRTLNPYIHQNKGY